MENIKQIVSALEGNGIPSNYEEKTIQKLIKKYQKLDQHRVVKLYPIRNVAHEDSRYCLYACPFVGTEIDEQTLQNIKSLIDELEVGHIRYDSVQSEGSDYYRLTETTGNHIINQEDRDAVMEISDHFEGIVLFTKTVFSPKHVGRLDCHYALIGIAKSPNEYQIEPIPNAVIGQGASSQRFSGTRIVIPDQEEPDAPAIEKYRSSMKVLSIIITIGLLIWYFLLR